ncbi:hypothetical protein AB0D57_41235 [Streptomyces sp. NPDC048275]|uniref:hypothetical protein n=1 Tax=Streptomyces sp. NPDC048275 TaxID=3155629 RepID=UPI0033DA6665
MPPHSRLDEEQMEKIVATVSEQALAAIRTAQDHVRAHARHRREYLADFEVGTEPGPFLGQRNIPAVAATAFETAPIRQRPHWAITWTTRRCACGPHSRLGQVAAGRTGQPACIDEVLAAPPIDRPVADAEEPVVGALHAPGGDSHDHG